MDFDWRALGLIIGVIFAGEGLGLLLIRDESWRSLREFIAGMSTGQIHTVGAVMTGIGALLLLTLV